MGGRGLTIEEPSGPLPSVWSILGEDMVSGRWGSGQKYPLHPQLGLLIDHTRTEIWTSILQGAKVRCRW